MLRITSVIFICLLILVALLFGALLTLDINRYKADIIRVVEAGTGREFTLGGDIQLAPSLVPTLVIEEASLGNAPWASQRRLLTVRRFEAEVDLLPLLEGQLRINRLILIGPQLALETDAQGQGNWVLAGAGETATVDGPQALAGENEYLGLDLQQIVVKDARISYRDGRKGSFSTVAVPELTLEGNAAGASRDLTLRALHEDLVLELSGQIGPLADLFANRPWDVDLKGHLNRLGLAVTGSMQRPLQAEGLALNLDLTAASLGDLPRPPPSRFASLGPARLRARLINVNGGHELNNLDLRLGEHRLRGDARLLAGDDRPLVYATLAAPRLDLTVLRERASGPEPERVFSRQPLALDWLRRWDGNLAIRTDELRLHEDWRLQAVELELGLRNGRLRLGPLTAKAAGGDLIGSLELHVPRRGVARWRSNLHVTALQPERLPMFADRIRDGATDITLDAAGRGDSLAEVMAGLEGSVLVYTGHGQIQSTTLEMAGADILFKTLSLLKPDQGEQGMTEIHCAVAAFRIRDGLAVSDRGLALETPHMTAVGGGSVNLATEELDLGLRPYPREGLGLSAGRFTGVARLRGTLSQPRTSADTLAAMQGAARVGAAVITGGMSLLAGGLLDRLSADEQPCNTAVDYAHGRQPQELPAAAPPAAEKSADGGGLGDRVRGLFQGLFNN